MNNMPKVSIIVPVFNAEKYLNKCVQSLVNQTIKEIEIILVDDGSIDTSPDLCDKWANIDSRIRVIHKINEGQSIARNVGLEIAKGDYIAFVDSDDFIELNTYEVMHQECQENNLDVAYFTFDRIDPNGKIVYTPNAVRREIFRGKEEVDLYYLNLIGRTPSNYTNHSYTTSASMSLFKSDIIRKYNLTFPNVREIASEDLLFSLMFIAHSKAVGYFPYVFYHYLVNEGSTTTSYSDAKYTRMMRCLEKIKALCDNRFDEKIYLPHFLSQILRIYKIAMRYETMSNDTLLVKCNKLRSYCCSSWMHIIYNHKESRKYPFRDRIYLFCMRYRILPFFFLIYR